MKGTKAMRGNQITLRLNRGFTARAGSLFQYDRGQRLLLTGVELPENYQVHFSNEELGVSKSVIGDRTGADIPDEYLVSGQPIHVWVYVSGEDHSETEYHGIIGVTRRALPTDAAPSPGQMSLIDQTLGALAAAVEHTEEIRHRVEEISEGMEDSSPPLDASLTLSTAAAPADQVGALKSAFNNSPALKDDDAEDSDLDISDSQGNVLVRFANGHIATKNFDSSEIPSGESQAAVRNSDAAGSDLDVTDSAGNVILRLKNGGIQTKNFDSSKQNVGVCYVAPNGSDSNTGDSESAPFATFQRAIDAGFKRIIAASGDYKNQQIVMNGLHGISIICNSNTTAETLFESHVRRTRAKIDNSIDVTGLTAYGSIYRAPLAVGEGSSFYKVFVSKTLDPVYSGSAYYGRVTAYNAVLWEIGEEIAGCTRLVPKLTLSECEAAVGTFFYDGTYLYIHPTGNSLTGKIYKRLNLDTDQYGVDVRNCTDIQIQGIDVAFFPYYDLHFAHCENLMVKDCCCTFTSYGSAVEVEGADAAFISCVAAKAGADGFGITAYGNVSFYDCSALYCYDDGISHHDAATGVIDGGKWIGCMKGGVTPSFGSNVSVKNVVCHGNVYGIYITQSGTRVTNAILTMQNCLAFDNVAQDIRVTGYDVISHGCAYRTKQIDDGASFAEYGNTVIE